MKRVITKYKLGDMFLIYLQEDNAETGLVLLPWKYHNKMNLLGEWKVDSLVQLKLVGDTAPIGFSHGHSMRNSDSVNQLRFYTQKLYYNGEERTELPRKEKSGDKIIILTELRSENIKAFHNVEYCVGTSYICVTTRIENCAEKEVMIEMLSSFSLCGFSIIEEENYAEEMYLYRLLSKWSAEGRLRREAFPELQMEPSWQRFVAQSIRFGEVGSMPVRRYFPWAVVEDARYHIMTGVQLYQNGSWQIELYERDDKAALSGGLADREFGHWMKQLQPKEGFTAPEAVISCCVGNIDEISERLVSAQKRGRAYIPAVEWELPIVFNEFCTTWGNPTQENLMQIVDVIKGKGIQYLVIDAGWYSKGKKDWNGEMGDWIVNEERFPGGFWTVADAIRRADMIPGLWFEMECVGIDTDAIKNTELQLKRDGIPIQTGVRRFWDMRLPKVQEYLTEKVIGTLKKYGFGYLKVDYNDNIGIGCDGAESLGEGLRCYTEASKEFFRKIRKELPELVIENCASGGHRLEPSMQALTSMSSFSDAHECLSIPVIAANVTRAILPEQSQIWAVLRAEDSLERLYYSLAATLLGRMCLSGDIYDLQAEQWEVVERGITFYKKVAPIIRDGRNHRFGTDILNYNKLTGWQAVVREALSGEQVLTVIHIFEFAVKEKDENGLDIDRKEIQIPLPQGEWEVEECFQREEINIQVKDGNLVVCEVHCFEGLAVLLKNRAKKESV